jgi:hypothetical protein
MPGAEDEDSKDAPNKGSGPSRSAADPLSREQIRNGEELEGLLDEVRDQADHRVKGGRGLRDSD